MTIDYAILGLLSWKPMTGYDIKRIIQDSPIMYWSGNNNQIYKALLKLLDDGCVTSETQYQESAPNKKVYSITEEGEASLKQWILDTEPERPELKKTFLIQLSWASELGPEEIAGLIDRYEETVKQQAAMYREEKKRQVNFPNRSEKERFLWEMTYENICMTYESELRWIEQLRGGMQKFR